MRITAAQLEKVEVLVATGMPGAYKVLIFFLLQQFHGLELLGQIASWQSIAQILGFFTAIGWCSLILVRVAKQDAERERVAVFNGLLLMGVKTLFVLSALVLLVGLSVARLMDAWQLVIWTCAWSFYQMPRHYLIALKRYRQALVLDFSVILISMVSVYLAVGVEVSTALAASMFFCGFAALIYIQDNSLSGAWSVAYDVKGLEYGLVNMLSGSIALSIVPLAAYFEGQALAGVVSLFLAASGIALLMPRAISLNQLPQMARCADNLIDLKLIHVRSKRYITWCNFVTTVIGALIALFLTLTLEGGLDAVFTGLVLSLLVLQSTASTQSLVYANVLMAQERSRPILWINVQSFTVFLVGCLFFIVVPLIGAFLYICLLVLFLSLFRLSLMIRSMGF